MGDDRVRAEIISGRSRLDELGPRLSELGSERARIENAIAEAVRVGDAATGRDLGSRLAELREERDRIIVENGEISRRLDELREEMFEAEFERTFAALGGEHPIALLPVRIETRFLPRDEPTHLAIRIYPDDIHIDTHEPELTADEISWGRNYWFQVWRAGDEVTERSAAWQLLAQRFGSNRAAWISDALSPLNPDDAPQRRLDDDAELAPEPRFPKVDERPGVWTRAPLARALPDRWVALGYTGGERVFSEWSALVAEELAVGPAPDPDAPIEGTEGTAPPDDQDELAIDDGMRWIVDFEQAMKVGMAIEVPLEEPFARHVDRLIVLGVRGSEDPQTAGERLSRLLQAHRFTRGVELLRHGTPTNNTEEKPSGFASDTSAAPASPPASEALYEPGDGRDGDRLDAALGIRRGSFDRVPGADRDQVSAGGDMHATLWPGTLGYFLEQFMTPALSDAAVDQVWAHFVSYVRGLGALPPLRLGRQPYGVLPIVPLDHVDPENDVFERELLGVLRNLLPFWRAGIARVPRMGATSDPDADLVSVLGMQPATRTVDGRDVYGPQFLGSLWATEARGSGSEGSTRLTHLQPQMLRLQEASAKAVMSTMGFESIRPRLFDLVLDALNDYGVGIPLVQSGTLSEDGRLDPDYITNLSAIIGGRGGIDALKQVDPKAPLLSVLLRQAALYLHSQAAGGLLTSVGETKTRVWLEPEFIDIENAEVKTTTPVRLLEREVAELQRDKPIGELVTGPLEEIERLEIPDAGRISDLIKDILISDEIRLPVGFNFAWMVQLKAFRRSLERLATRSPAELERLLTETIDVCSHRLDAWISSVATRRLSILRERHDEGVHIGAYAWVENLSFRAGHRRVNEVIEGEEDGPIFDPIADQGYIHAPSMAHAATAALLRTGYATHAGEDREPFAIDLSSARVRLALELLGGVREGQPIGALLGYRFERALHEAHPELELDQFILPLRKLAPLVRDVMARDEGHEPDEAIAARNVVDGERLLTLFREGAIPWGDEDKGFPGDSLEKDAIVSELLRIEDAVDAVGDVLVSESVYQAIQGNPVRSGAAAAAIDRGGTPPDPEVVRTPRTGIGFTHRVLAFLDPSPSPAPGWPTTRSPRSAASPILDASVGRLLGKPEEIRVVVRYVAAGPEEESRSKTFRVSELRLSALDVLYGGASELEARLRDHARREPPSGVATDASVEILTGRDESWGSSTVGLEELLTLAGDIRSLVAGARSADARDLSVPEDPVDAAVDVDHLRQRADAAEEGFRDARSRLGSILATESPTASQLRNALFDGAAFGVAGAVPVVAGTTDEHLVALREQVPGVLAAMDHAIAELDRAGSDFTRSGASPAAEIAHDEGRLRRIFGDAFRAVTPFRPANGPELNASFGRSEDLQGGDSLAASTWLLRMARVREGCMRLVDVLTGAESLGYDGALEVAQLPNHPEDLWLGMSFNESFPRGHISIVAHRHDDGSFEGPVAGLVIDDWHEVVPRPIETTGVAFNFDQPGARAPHTILLAVPPDRDAWSLQKVEATVLEALELAKIRAVDLNALHWIPRLLPALYLPNNPDEDSGGIDLRGLVKNFREMI